MEADSTSTNGSNGSNNGDYEFISNEESFGSAVQIVKVTEDSQFELDLEALSSILLRDNVRDTPVVVVSIAGNFRKGKSFMLNFFLRFLQSGSADWLSDKNMPLRGFSWRGGFERDTTGILMWSEPFIIRLESGEEVAVLLMDTQGAFDCEYTIGHSATIFALSTMCSSIQVFNLMHNLQEIDLQVLEIFTEYGRLAFEETNEKPFQKLMFLIRDWSYPYELNYGLLGGQQLLEKRLAISDKQKPEIQNVRQRIKACFSEISCYLMPYPGMKVATNPEFNGRVGDIEDVFVQHLDVLVNLLLSSKNLVVKEIAGRRVTGNSLVEFFKAYINVFAGEKMPEPKTMLVATAEANNMSTVKTVKDEYHRLMEELCGGGKPYLNPQTLEAKHNEYRQQAIDEFDNTKKIGGKEFSEGYREMLIREIDASFEKYIASNNDKNLSAMSTPLVLLVACVICVLTSRVFDMVGLTPLANLFFLIFTIDLGLIIVYLFCRYTGNYPDVISFVDYMAEKIWLFALELGVSAMQNALESRLRTNTTNSTNRSPISSPAVSSQTSHPLSSRGLSAQKKTQ